MRAERRLLDPHPGPYVDLVRDRLGRGEGGGEQVRGHPARPDADPAQHAHAAEQRRAVHGRGEHDRRLGAGGGREPGLPDAKVVAMAVAAVVVVHRQRVSRLLLEHGGDATGDLIHGGGAE